VSEARVASRSDIHQSASEAEGDAAREVHTLQVIRHVLLKAVSKNVALYGQRFVRSRR
jgi:hypothetical protein